MFTMFRKLLVASELFHSAIMAQIEMEGMKAENQDRLSKGESVSYVERDFMSIIESATDRSRIINTY